VQKVRMVARDSKMPRFTNDDYALHRPGFRTASSGTTFNDQLDGWFGRDAKREANKAYEDALVNAWRKPVRPDAAGDDTAMTHNAHRNERENADKRSIGQQMRDHRRVMDEVCAAHARDLETAWKR
jgi:hypothetical protein